MLIATNLLDPLAIALLLAVLGLVLLVAEVFFPSGGVLGLLSASAFLGSIYYAFNSSGGMTAGVTVLVLEVIVVPIVVLYAINWLPETSVGKAMLGEAPRGEDVLPDDDRHALVGRIGVARSRMLPSGDIEIDGQMLDAVSRGQAIEPGAFVKVVEVQGNRLMVRLAAESERPANPNPGDLLARPADEIGLGELEIDGLGIDGLGIDASRDSPDPSVANRPAPPTPGPDPPTPG